MACISQSLNGVLSFDKNNEAVVETSNNLGIVKMADDAIQVTHMYRSSNDEVLKELKNEMAVFMSSFGFNTFQIDNEFPAWQPVHDSRLLKIAKKVFIDFGEEVTTEVTHGGLETAFFAQKMKNTEMISIGPDIKDPHSQAERLKVDSVPKIYRILLALLTEIGFN